MVRTLTRSLIAGTALTGALTFGAAGLAGATTTTTPAPAATPATKAAHCAKAEARVPKIEARETKAAAWVTKAEAREAVAVAAHHPKIATRIGHRIDKVKKAEAKGTALLAKIAAKCGAATTTS